MQRVSGTEERTIISNEFENEANSRRRVSAADLDAANAFVAAEAITQAASAIGRLFPGQYRPALAFLQRLAGVLSAASRTLDEAEAVDPKAQKGTVN